MFKLLLNSFTLIAKLLSENSMKILQLKFLERINQLFSFLLTMKKNL